MASPKMWDLETSPPVPLSAPPLLVSPKNRVELLAPEIAFAARVQLPNRHAQSSFRKLAILALPRRHPKEQSLSVAPLVEYYPSLPISPRLELLQLMYVPALLTLVTHPTRRELP